MVARHRRSVSEGTSSWTETTSIVSPDACMLAPPAARGWEHYSARSASPALAYRPTPRCAANDVCGTAICAAASFARRVRTATAARVASPARARRAATARVSVRARSSAARTTRGAIAAVAVATAWRVTSGFSAVTRSVLRACARTRVSASPGPVTQESIPAVDRAPCARTVPDRANRSAACRTAFPVTMRRSAVAGRAIAICGGV